MKGRVIGANGKSRTVIEELTESNISVYGKTISIIAPIDTINDAKQATEELLGGAQHAGVYHTLEKKRRNRKMAEIIGTRQEKKPGKTL